MKLIIDIPKEKYEWIKKNNPNADTNSIVGVVANGTPYKERLQGDNMTEEMTIELALEMLYNGDLYDQKGYLTEEGYRALGVLENVNLKVFDLIDNASTMPKGEWKFIQGATTQGSLKCPFCDYRDYHKTNSNFCPNCGADMKGEEE